MNTDGDHISEAAERGQGDTSFTETLDPPAPLVSIGMPVYNADSFIREALDSLLDQTFVDFELIISDNASADSTETICREYATTDSRIRYVRQQENMGSLANFRFVLDAAKGQYFMWAAYDDLRTNNFIEELIKGFEDHEVVTAFGVCREIDGNGKLLTGDIILDFDGASATRRIWKYWSDRRALRDIPIYGLHKRDVLQKFNMKPWGWPNQKNPLNTVHPTMTYQLSAGRYYFHSGEVIFFRRVLPSSSWCVDVAPRGKIKSAAAFVVRKLELCIRSLQAVYRGSQSSATVVHVLPVLVCVTFRDLCSAMILQVFRVTRRVASTLCVANRLLKNQLNERK